MQTMLLTDPFRRTTLAHDPMQARFATPAMLTLGTLAMLALAGCHHSQQVAYMPPPPPLPPSNTSAHVTHPTAKPHVVEPAVLGNAAKLDDMSGTPSIVEYGTASWYGPQYHHHAAADGSVYDQDGLTAAHRTLPLGSTVRVTNVATNQSVIVRITDRGPFSPGRVLDLSMGAAKAIGVYRAGLAKVKIEAWPHDSADPAGKWCVQIGAFKDEGDAIDVKTALLSRYKTAKVIEFTGPTGHWVRINPAKPDLAHANEVARALESPDPNALPYVVRLD